MVSVGLGSPGSRKGDVVSGFIVKREYGDKHVPDVDSHLTFESLPSPASRD